MREPDALDDAVARADLFRSRQAAFGPARDPESLRFAASVITAMADGARAGVVDVPLPESPAVVCDRAGRIVRSNPAFHRLAGAACDADLFGMRLSQILSGPDRDARLLRTDGNTVGVGVVRFSPLDGELAVVALVERGGPRSTEGRVDRTWAAELERLARLGTWSLDLATGALARSDTLEELYRDVGLDPANGVEHRQADALRAALAAGAAHPDEHAELHLPGDVLLSCRAELEWSADGLPLRVVEAEPLSRVRSVLGAEPVVEQRPRCLSRLGIPGRAPLLDGFPDGRHAGCGRDTRIEQALLLLRDFSLTRHDHRSRRRAPLLCRSRGCRSPSRRP